MTLLLVEYARISLSGHRSQYSLMAAIALWTRLKEIRPLPDLAFNDGYCCHFIPMVLLGLLSHFFPLD